MKTAIYIENDVVQVVLTGENEWEKKALDLIKNSATVTTHKGQFYECMGGWYRHGNVGSDSLMFRLDGEKKNEEMMTPCSS